MSDSIDITDLGDEIEEILKENFKEIGGKVVTTTNRVANNVRDKLKQNSPKRTGKYAEGWTTQKNDTRKDSIFGSYEVVVHNKTHWMTVHLLELGHAIKGGTKRVKAYPHIRPAEEEAAEEFYNELQKKLSEG